MLQDSIKKLVFITFAVCLWAPLTQALPVAPGQFVPGQHYELLPTNIRNNPEIKQLLDEDPDKPQVVMFFSYGCYWCSRIDPVFDQWAEEHPNIAIKKYPVIFNRSWQELAKAYYTINEYDNSRELDNKIFSAIHHKRMNLARISILEKFISQQGLDGTEFRKNYESFGVGRKVKRAEELGDAYEINETPMFVINAKNESYKTSWAMVGSQATLFAVIEHLLQKN